MVDYIKILVKELESSILENNPLLVFHDNVNIHTGEIRTTNRKGQKITPYKNAFYNGLEFKIYSTGTITIAGSLHKYWNSGDHNYNDFNLKAFDEVLKDLEIKFDINLNNAIIKVLEIGINITPPIPTNQLLRYCFLHKTKPFEYKKNSEKGNYKQAEHSQYIIKLYNKALHYKNDFDIEVELLRFEIKFTKMEKLNRRGINTLQDLQNYGLVNFKNDLLIEFNNILYFDKTIKSKSKKITDYKNPIYWIELLNRPSKSSYYKHKEKLKQLTVNYSENIQRQTLEIISKKIDILNERGARIDPLTILSIPTPPFINRHGKNKLCQITGVSISMQKENSILLSHTGLKYYYKNERKVFEQIKRKYLSKLWINSDSETQIKEIAHNIRNTKSNQRIKQIRLYQPQQLNLLSVYRF